MRAILVVGLLLFPSLSRANVDYLRDVKPLLTRCYPCHGALQQKGGLRLDTAALARRGGDEGPAVLPGRGTESLLIQRLLGQGGKRMPPKDEGEPLEPAQIALVRRWIDAGAPAPADERPEADPRDHWAFRAPVRPKVPGASGQNPIDAFLDAERGRIGVPAQPEAERRLLLRRLTLDLVGLPPTALELDAFVRDPAPDAYEKAVDRLLRSPQHGERWGRHWMDIWRYSDWWGLGAEVRNSQKHIWHWRDWIVDSLNTDKGYDQMIREMLAADELYPDDLDRLRGNGYLARPYFKFNRNSWLEDLIEHTAKGFLGLTLNCARCHEHKYDPLSQVEYYRFRAFFEPYQVRTELLPGELDVEKNGLPRGYDAHPEAPTYLFVRGNDTQPVKDKPLTPAVPGLLSLGQLKIRQVTLPPTARHPGLRPHVLSDHLRGAEARVASARAALDQARKALANATPVESAWVSLIAAEKALAAAEAEPDALRARALADRETTAVHIQSASRAERALALRKAEADLAQTMGEALRTPPDKKAAVDKKLVAAKATVAQAEKALEAPGTTYTPLRGALKTLESNLETEASRLKPFPATSTGRRTALATWITDARNPLTARVAVNHVWSRHFGRPLVATVFDFGRKGARPTHPELLDWLACELIESGWSLKHLHRLIVTSRAYRASSSPLGNEAGSRLDPENRLYWRMNPIRLDAQVLRDSLLHLAADLDLRLGGPSLDPIKEASSRRRSLYFVHSHNDHHKFLASFDDASVLECYRRAESIVPQQALALSNSALALSQAARIADRVIASTEEGFAQAAFATVLATQPTPEEAAACVAALKEWRVLAEKAGAPDPGRRARIHLVLALVNHNDFITIR